MKWMTPMVCGSLMAGCSRGNSLYQIGKQLRGVRPPGAARGRSLARQPVRIIHRRYDEARQNLRRQRSLLAYFRTSGCGKRGGVRRLVVVERVRVRHEDRRPADRRDLRDRGGAGAGDHQMRLGHAPRHVVEEGRDFGVDA
jgi:hypothetical protein